MSNRIDDAKAIATDVFGEDDVIRRVDAVEALAEWGISPLVLMPVPSAQQWIPCSERLPEIKIGWDSDVNTYLVTVDDGAIYTDVDIIRKSGFNKHGSNVTAWMPLPEPYTKDGDDDDE